jgi:hypothetical protein
MYTQKQENFHYSGAEIEAAIDKAILVALANAMDGGIDEPIPNEDYDIDTELLAKCLQEVIPLASTRREDIGRLRGWALERAKYASNQQKRMVTGGESGYTHSEYQETSEGSSWDALAKQIASELKNSGGKPRNIG